MHLLAAEKAGASRTMCLLLSLAMEAWQGLGCVRRVVFVEVWGTASRARKCEAEEWGRRQEEMRGLNKFRV